MIEIAKIVDEELVQAINLLIPQLTDSTENISADRIKSIVESESNFLLIARNEKQAIVGTLTLVIFSIPTNKKAFIEDVVVDASAQGLGLGQKLVDFAITLAKEHDASRIELSSNPARIAANSLYQKLGFEIRNTNFYRLQL